ncbi:MAG: glycoside hydrolase family 3 N-terminal domain-containing protein [Chloroflexota bacterium]
MQERQLYMDATRPTEERVSDLLARMTLEEKAAQLGSFWIYELLDNMAFAPDKAARLLKHGIGHVTRLGGASNLLPQDAAKLANTIQKYIAENTRLGIPAIIHEECCSGYMARGATVFPQAIGIASAWEPELVEAMTSVIREQMRSVGAHHALAPVLDVARDARWGRVEETFGEDPYLVAALGTAYVRGIQGSDLKHGVVATGKHFVGYSASEGGLNWAPPHINRRELLEVYLHPFEAAVREAGLASIMNGYHELDGIPCGSNRELLTEILRDQWKFEGTVVSDYFAINQLYEYHHIAPSKDAAALLALEAGLDVELPATDCFGGPLVEAVEAGRIPVELVDRAVSRVLEQKFALGLFENPYVDEGAVAFDTPPQRELARTLAEKSIVLLKNDGNLLPLSPELKSIAVIGPNADSVRNLFGDYAYPAHIETLIESREKSSPFGQPDAEDIREIDDFIPAISILQAIRERAGEGVEVRYAKGCEVLDTSTDGFAEAVEAATGADVAIVVVGDKAGLTDECTSGEARDRAVLDLPGVQADLVKAVYDTGTPVVLVLVNGRPVTLNWIAEDVPAIVEAWFPAEEGANAIAGVLFGDVNPGGKLPISFPRTVGQVPVYYGHKPSGGRSHWKVDYVETSVKPQYPFGFGLSYTQFKIDNLRLKPAEARAGETITVQVDVTNTGARAGDEVVQLYTRQVPPYITRPVKELKGFKRLTLNPGETKTVTFHLPVNLLAFYDRDYRYVVEPGTVDIMVGNSSQDVQASATLTITGEKTEVEKVFFSRAEVE